jgi:argininosuccinate lyase
VQDLNSWTGLEIGHLPVPDAFVQVSSIMPQKRNPVPVEHLRLMASLGAARCEAVSHRCAQYAVHRHERLRRRSQVAGYDAFDTAQRFMPLLRGLLDVVDDRRREGAPPHRRGGHYARRARRLARAAPKRIPFRQAHEVASKLARADDRRRYDDLEDSRSPLFAQIFQRRAQPDPRKLTEAQFRQFTTPEHFIAVRTMRGGPAPSALAASFARYRCALAAKRAALAAFAERQRAADDLLAARWRAGLRTARMPRRDARAARLGTHGASSN